ncbi:hypothetical protein AB0H69_48375 [Streptomyces phaeochromogenes]|uniref:hypothetical protein n=1 Tax=Streptomyces phaeochromogenes TaxID=1923 RepID=UPI0033F2E467
MTAVRLAPDPSPVRGGIQAAHDPTRDGVDGAAVVSDVLRLNDGRVGEGSLPNGATPLGQAFLFLTLVDPLGLVVSSAPFTRTDSAQALSGLRPPGDGVVAVRALGPYTLQRGGGEVVDLSSMVDEAEDLELSDLSVGGRTGDRGARAEFGQGLPVSFG